MKSPSSPMKLWPFLCNVLLQFSQHWRVVHLHRTLAAALHKFQRLYALSGNRIVLRCTAPLATSPFSGMRKNKWGQQHRAVLPTYQQESAAAFGHYTWNPALFKYSWYLQVTIKAATGQTQSQSLLIRSRTKPGINFESLSKLPYHILTPDQAQMNLLNIFMYVAAALIDY